MSRESTTAYMMACRYRNLGGLRLDLPGRIDLLQQEIDPLREKNRAARQAHEATCDKCREVQETGKGFCAKRFGSDVPTQERRHEIELLTRFINVEKSNQEYADKAREHLVDLDRHTDGFNQFWQCLRFRRLALCNWKCEVPGCEKHADDCHHLTYNHEGYEELDDVRMLCRGCHEAQHGGPFREKSKPEGFYVRYLHDLGEKRRAAGIPDPPETHDAAYWDERRRWNAQKSVTSST